MLVRAVFRHAGRDRQVSFFFLHLIFIQTWIKVFTGKSIALSPSALITRTSLLLTLSKKRKPRHSKYASITIIGLYPLPPKRKRFTTEEGPETSASCGAGSMMSYNCSSKIYFVKKKKNKRSSESFTWRAGSCSLHLTISCQPQKTLLRQKCRGTEKTVALFSPHSSLPSTHTRTHTYMHFVQMGRFFVYTKCVC